MIAFPIVGMKHHEGALELLRSLRDGYPMRLCPEPDNKYDPNAVAVWAVPGPRIRTLTKVGYIPASMARDARKAIRDQVHIGELIIAADRPDTFTVRIASS